MTLNQITTAIRAVNGEVMLCGPTSFGFVIRALIGGHSCRLVILQLAQKPSSIPIEPNTQTHVISDGCSLQTWLNSLSPNRVLQAL